MKILNHYFNNRDIILHIKNLNNKKNKFVCTDEYYIKCFKWFDNIWYLEYLQSINFTYDTNSDEVKTDYETMGNSLSRIIDKGLINTLIGFERKKKLEKLLS